MRESCRLVDRLVIKILMRCAWLCDTVFGRIFCYLGLYGFDCSVRVGVGVGVGNVGFRWERVWLAFFCWALDSIGELIAYFSTGIRLGLLCLKLRERNELHFSICPMRLACWRDIIWVHLETFYPLRVISSLVQVFSIVCLFLCVDVVVGLVCGIYLVVWSVKLRCDNAWWTRVGSGMVVCMMVLCVCGWSWWFGREDFEPGYPFPFTSVCCRPYWLLALMSFGCVCDMWTWPLLWTLKSHEDTYLCFPV